MRLFGIILLVLIFNGAYAAEGGVAPSNKPGGEMKPGNVFKDCPDCPEMVVIPEGSFEMGEDSIRGSVKNKHYATIGKAFALGKTEVTQRQWKAIMGENPSQFGNCGDTCPVENVSWSDAQQFIQKLNAKTGKQYRLPTEAEWEYACRAGGKHTYCGSDSVDKVVWHDGNSNDTTRPAGQKLANAFGLHDMSGNVWEWVENSHYNSSGEAPGSEGSRITDRGLRPLRGGSWADKPFHSRAASRMMSKQTFRSRYSGFRLARTLP